MRPNLEQFIELKSQVWDAFVKGDYKADVALLDDKFFGVYAGII